MQIKGNEFENVCYRIETAKHEFYELVESAYIGTIITELADALGAAFYDYQFIIYSRPTYRKGMILSPPPVFEKSNKKQVVLYISDELSSVPDVMAAQVFAVFKHFLPGNLARRNIYPLPLGYNKSTQHRPVIPIHQRKYNAFFFGQLSTPRIELYKSLAHLHFVPEFILNGSKKVLKRMRMNFDSAIPDSFIRFTTGFQNGLGPDHYAATLYTSKIAICPPGLVSPETLRHYEAMRAGCIIITKPLPEHSFYKDAPMLVLKDWSKLKEVVKELLQNPRRMEQMHLETIQWWNTRCSEPMVASSIAQTLSSLEAQSLSSVPMPALTI